MNLQQLRYVNEIVRRGLKISDAADALYTSQPNISKQIKQLEQELGIDIFVRNGKRVVALTEPGQAITMPFSTGDSSLAKRPPIFSFTSSILPM